MNNKEITIKCPCCETIIFVDKETGGILNYKEPVKEKSSLDGLVSNFKAKSSDKSDPFKKAMEAEKNRKKLLEKKFKRAKENIDELEDPERPYDYD